MAHRVGMTPWQIVAAVAAAQFGLVTRWQLRALGLSRTAIDDRLRGQGWRVLHPGVYALPGVPSSALRRAAAALLACSQPRLAPGRVAAHLDEGLPCVDALIGAAFGPWAVLTGPTVAHLRGALKAEPATVHVLLRPGQSLVARSGTTLSWAPVLAEEIEQIDGLPATVITRALADIAALGPGWFSNLMTAIATADALRQATLDEFESAAAPRGPFKGKRLLDRALAELRGQLSHSKTEAWARRKVGDIARRYGLTVHPRPYAIEVGGRIVAEADLAIVEVRHGIEVDGPHHLLPAQVVADKRRDRAAGRAGWTTDRYLVTEIEANRRRFLAEVEARIRSLAEQKRRSGLP